MTKATYDHTQNISTITNGIISANETQRFTERTIRILNDSERLSELSNNLRNVISDKSQGNLFEQIEVIKFNYDALKKDSDLYAKTTASMGFPTDPVDIIIKDGQKTVQEVQAKSCNSAARSTFALSNEKYKEMQRLSPKDQHAAIEKLLKKRIKAGTLKAKDYEQTLRNLKKTLSHDDVSSSGTTYQEALDSTNQEVADKIAEEYKRKAVLTDMHKSGMEAGKNGAMISGGMAVLTEGYDFFYGEQELADAAINTSIAAAKGYATGYTVTAISKGITHTSSYFLGESISKSITRSNAHIAFAAGIVSTAKSMASYLTGEINFKQLSDQINHTAITSTSAFYYGALGQVTIPIPVVGALVGSGVGYLIGNLIHQSGLIALGDSSIVKEAKARRQQLEQFCLRSIPQIQKHRKELELQLEQHRELRQHKVDLGFSIMDKSLESLNPDEYLKGLNLIGEQFGIILPYKNFEEFDRIMTSNETLRF